jgi:hypothetical protein
MVAIQVPVLEKVLRTVLVYATVIVLFRVSGKRGFANLNTLDLTVIMLLSNVVQDAIIGSDDSLLGGVIGAVTLVVVNAGLNHALSRSDQLTGLIQGDATTDIEGGHVVDRAPRRLALWPSQLDHAVKDPKRRRHQRDPDRPSRTGRPARTHPQETRTERHKGGRRQVAGRARQHPGRARGTDQPYRAPLAEREMRRKWRHRDSPDLNTQIDSAPFAGTVALGDREVA